MVLYRVIFQGREWPVCGAHIWELLSRIEAQGLEPDSIRHGEEPCPRCRP